MAAGRCSQQVSSKIRVLHTHLPISGGFLLSQQDTGSTAAGEEKELLHGSSAKGGARAAAMATVFIRHQKHQKRSRAGTERARLFKRLGGGVVVVVCPKQRRKMLAEQLF